MTSGSQLVRLRFLNDITAQELIVQIEELQPSTYISDDRDSGVAENKMAIERDIFLRASIQLLSQRDQMEGVSVLSPHDKESSVRSHRKGPKLLPEYADSFDLIRQGVLDKCSRAGKFSAGQGQWKSKFVEVRHGVISYDDLPYGPQFDELPALEELAQQHRVSGSRRALALSPDQVVVRIVDTGGVGGPEGSRIFELACVDGSRRFFQAGSPRECWEWVRAIHAAMLGGEGGVTGECGELRGGMLHSALIQNGAALPAPLTASSSTPFKPTPHPTLSPRWRSRAGWGARYAEDLSLFMQLQRVFTQAREEAQVRRIFSQLHSEHATLTLPVSFVKSKCSHSTLACASPDLAQVWKDLSRDVLVINGERVSGEVDGGGGVGIGVEGMVGALARHISDVCSSIKKTQARLHLLGSALTDRERLMGGASFSLSEAAIVASARDLLVACSRTSSGGDTYLCMSSLLGGPMSSSTPTPLSTPLLTPLYPTQPPLTFTVDAVILLPPEEGDGRDAGNAEIPPPTSPSLASIPLVSHTPPTPLATDPLPLPAPHPRPLEAHSAALASPPSHRGRKGPNSTSNLTPHPGRKGGRRGGRSPPPPAQSEGEGDVSDLGVGGVRRRGVRRRGHGHPQPTSLPSYRDSPSPSPSPSSSDSEVGDSRGNGPGGGGSRLDLRGALRGELEREGFTLTLPPPPAAIPDDAQSAITLPPPVTLAAGGGDGGSVVSELTFDTLRYPHSNFQSVVTTQTMATSQGDSLSPPSSEKVPPRALLRGWGRGGLHLPSPFKQKRVRGRGESEVDGGGSDLGIGGGNRVRRNSETILPPPLRLFGRHSHLHSSYDSGDNSRPHHHHPLSHSVPTLLPVSSPPPLLLGVRVRCEAHCMYRVCSPNPSGEEKDTWGGIRGTFQQTFLLGLELSKGVLAMGDRVVLLELTDGSVETEPSVEPHK